MARQVRELMNKQPIKLAGSSPIAEAARRMRDANVGAVLVEDGGKICGIVTDRDIAVRAVAGEKRFAELVRAYLERHPSRHWSLNPLGHAFARFLEREVPRLPRRALLAELAQLGARGVLGSKGAQQCAHAQIAHLFLTARTRSSARL